MLRVLLMAAATISICAPASAQSGAELLQDNETFGMGYVWGAVDYMVNNYTQDDDAGNRLTKHRAECLSKAGITAKTIYDAVVGEIRNDTSAMSQPASVAIDTVVFKICGRPPD